MAETYEYRVRHRQGTLRTGEIAGDSRELVMARLRELGFIPLELSIKKAGFNREIRLFPGRVKKKDLAVFSRQFATMVNSGLPLLRALAILEEQTENKELVRVIAVLFAGATALTPWRVSKRCRDSPRIKVPYTNPQFQQREGVTELFGALGNQFVDQVLAGNVAGAVSRLPQVELLFEVQQIEIGPHPAARSRRTPPA